MFKYNLIGDNDYIFDPQGTILANRGIDDVDVFMNLSEDVTHHYSLLKNIEKAVNCLIENLNKESRILIVVDPDVDGYTSSTILYQYLKTYDDQSNIEWVLHNDKKHGFEGIDISKDVNLIILPDGGSNDFEYHKKYKELGIDVIVLDHHEADRESENAIVVNSQFGNYSNLNLSGAGIVLKFCQALDDKLNIKLADNFYDLVALGCIADVMSMKELETRYYVQVGLSGINNDFLNALIRKQEFSTKGKVNITTIGFYIAPLINAVIRAGELQDKIDMFRAFIGEKQLVKYKPRGYDEMLVPFVDDMARRCVNIKNSKQTKIVDKVVQDIEQHIEVNNLLKNKSIFLYDVTDIDEGITGLVASKIVSKYKKPTIILNKSNSEGYYKGSARGYDKGELKDFKDVILKSDLFSYALGHTNAFGVEVHKEQIEKVNDVLNDLLSEYSFDNLYDVDFELKAESLSSSLIFDICDLEDLWGKDISEPYLLIKGLKISESDVRLMGKSENTIGIKYNDIKYIIFRTNSETYEHIMEAQTIDLIGRASVNLYEGVTYPQIIVNDFILNK